uniref:Uncharacterized protein n=1 Tax=Trichogramma kaykai TaxID=54128 RepID=A0ABD2X3X5_9HYME
MLSAARRELGRIIKKDTRPTEWSIGRRVAARPDKAKRDQCVSAARGIPDARVSSCSFEKTDNHPPATTIRAASTKQRLMYVAAAARGEELIARQHDSFWQAEKSLSPGVNRRIHTRCRVSLSLRRTRDHHNVAESQCSLYGCTRAPSHSRDLLSKPRQNLIKISYTVPAIILRSERFILDSVRQNLQQQQQQQQRRRHTGPSFSLNLSPFSFVVERNSVTIHLCLSPDRLTLARAHAVSLQKLSAHLQHGICVSYISCCVRLHLYVYVDDDDSTHEAKRRNARFVVDN